MTPATAVARGCDPAPADRGSATVWVLLCGLPLVAGAVVLALLATATLARHRAATAADAAALAAAAHLLEPAPAVCATAARIAAVNDAEVARCVVRDGTVAVTTRMRPPGWLGRFGTVSGVARAEQIPANPAYRH
jgi:secretion/DNA translocation related TadE-like protein